MRNFLRKDDSCEQHFGHLHELFIYGFNHRINMAPNFIDFCVCGPRNTFQYIFIFLSHLGAPGVGEYGVEEKDDRLGRWHDGEGAEDGGPVLTLPVG